MKRNYVGKMGKILRGKYKGYYGEVVEYFNRQEIEVRILDDDDILRYLGVNDIEIIDYSEMDWKMIKKNYGKVIENYKLVEFDSHDWDCYAGAEEFDDGQKPFIGQVNAADPILGVIEVIVDKNGVAFIYMDYDNDIHEWHIKTHNIDESFQILNSFDHKSIHPILFIRMG